MQLLNALVTRWCLAFGSSKPLTEADLEPPDLEENPNGSQQSQGILDSLEENAFANAR